MRTGRIDGVSLHGALIRTTDRAGGPHRYFAAPEDFVGGADVFDHCRVNDECVFTAGKRHAWHVQLCLGGTYGLLTDTRVAQEQAS